MQEVLRQQRRRCKGSEGDTVKGLLIWQRLVHRTKCSRQWHCRASRDANDWCRSGHHTAHARGLAGDHACKHTLLSCLHESRGAAASLIATVGRRNTLRGGKGAGSYDLGLRPSWSLAALELLEVLIRVIFVRANQGSLELKIREPIQVWVPCDRVTEVSKA